MRTLLLLILPALSGGVDLSDVTVTRWTDPLGRNPIPKTEYERIHVPAGPVSLRVEAERQGLGSSRGRVALVVNESLYGEIEAHVDTLIQDLTAEGYGTVLLLASGEVPESLRARLSDLHGEGLVGAILIGQLPVAWFQMDNEWPGEDVEEFPIDLYFMDLDGQWVDADSDGLFDEHQDGSGDLEPEIWIGRICASNLTWGGEAELTRGYLEKNHLYRTGGLSVPDRSLAFVDDDWIGFGSSGLEFLYDDITVIETPSFTTASRYREELQEGYEFVHIMAHSCPWVHTFYPEGVGGSVYNFEIPLLDPKALFYNLFACSNARFVEQDNLGSWYVFCSTYGLLSVGSTKTGAMLLFEDFYGPLSEGLSLGDAFKAWAVLYLEESRSWFYGLTLLGDPTLRPGLGTQAASRFPEPGYEALDDAAYSITESSFSDGNPRIARSDSAGLTVAWHSGRDVRSNIYTSRFDGIAWTSPQVLEPNEYWDLFPDLNDGPDGRLWIIWHGLHPSLDHNLLACNRGSSAWSATDTLTTHPGYDVQPCLATDSSRTLHAAWKTYRDGTANIYLTQYDGIDWSAPFPLTSSAYEDDCPSLLGGPDGDLWLLHTADLDGNREIFSVKCISGTWSPGERITDDPGDDVYPVAVRLSNGDVLLAWQSQRAGNAEIRLMRWNGQGWIDTLNVSDDPGQDLRPAVVLGSDRTEAVIAWQSDRSGNWDLYARRFRSDSLSPTVSITSNEADDLFPDLAVDDLGSYWIVWQSDRNGNWDIFALPLDGFGTGESKRIEPGVQIRLFPNPARESVRMQGIRSAGEVPLEVTLYDVTGRSVLSKTFPRLSGDALDLDLTALPGGVYLLRLESREIEVFRRLLLLD
jgi:hypothetical protein